MAHTNPSFYFQSGGVRLRAMQNADWQHMYEEEDDSEGIRVFEAGVQYPRSPEQIQARVIQAVERSTKGESTGNWFFVVETLSGLAVGVGNFHGYDPRSGTFSFAIRIYRPFRGKGYAREALRILLRYGFEELRCQKANSATVSSNLASIRLHESLGFQIEGRIRRNVFTCNEYQDEVLFGMTKEEWEAQEGSRG